jgi:hypothetical protein
MRVLMATLCNVSYELDDRSGTAGADVVISVIPQHPVVGHGDLVLLPEREEFTADASGVGVMPLYPGSYEGRITLSDDSVTRFLFCVPEKDTANLADLMTQNVALSPTLVEQTRVYRDQAEAFASIINPATYLTRTGSETATNKTIDSALNTLTVNTGEASFEGADGEPLQYVKDWAGLMAIPSTAVAVGDTVFRMDTQSIYTRSATASDVQQSGGSSMHFDVEPYPWGAVTVKQFGPVGTSDDDDTMNRFWSYLIANPQIEGFTGADAITFDQTKSLSTAARSLVGRTGNSERTGSTRQAGTLIWAGGASPMFDASTSAHSFKGIDVEGNGVGTDFLEMNAGSQRVVLENMFFLADSFTRSVIRSNGNRSGYMQFHRLTMTQPAPVFLDIDGQGTSNGIVPISSSFCKYINNGSGGTDPWTVINVEDETLEKISFFNDLFVSRGGLVAVDTRTSPLGTTILNLIIDDCEIDNAEGALHRLFQLVNVRNIVFTNNVVTGDGTPTALFKLVNSNVSQCYGNEFKSFNGHIFEADDASRIRGVGANVSDASSFVGICDNPKCLINTFDDVGASNVTMKIGDQNALAPDQVEHFEVVATGNGIGTFVTDTVKPENIEIGQMFTVTVKNERDPAATCRTPVWGAGFRAPVATYPAANSSRTWMFIFDGTDAVYVSGGDVDVPNA